MNDSPNFHSPRVHELARARAAQLRTDAIDSFLAAAGRGLRAAFAGRLMRVMPQAVEA
jgi:hypothetical protein